MKIKFLLLSFLLLSFSSVAFAQSVIVKPKKIVYTRKGKNFPKERRTFDVIYPIISGSISPAAKKKLENTISYWKIFETPLREYFEDTYLESLSYKVNYSKNGILNISLIQEGFGAYPSTQTVNLVVDLQSGKAVKFDDVFKTESKAMLIEIVDKKLQAEKAEIIKAINNDKYLKDETKEEKESNKQMVADLQFTNDSFNEFSVSDKGATILYDAGFAHAWLALQPNGRYFFTWAQLKPFIRRDGLLARFVS